MSLKSAVPLCKARRGPKLVTSFTEDWDFFASGLRRAKFGVKEAEEGLRVEMSAPLYRSADRALCARWWVLDWTKVALFWAVVR